MPAIDRGVLLRVAPEVSAIAHRLFIVARLVATNRTSLEIAR